MKCILKPCLLGLLLIGSSAFAEDRPQFVETSPLTPIESLSQLGSDPVSAYAQLDQGFEFPKIVQLNTKGKATALFVERHEIPMVDVRVTFNAGSARDLEIEGGGAGLAALTASMLTKGTQKFSEDELNLAEESLGANISAQSYRDMFVVSLKSLSSPKTLAESTELFVEVAARPKFTEQVFERIKAKTLQGLSEAQKKPQVLASEAFFKAVYQDHPYAHPSSGTLESVSSMPLEALQAFQKQLLVRQNASVAITGDLSVEQATALANRILDALPSSDQPKALPEPKPTEFEHLHIDHDSEQTQVVLGLAAVSRDNPNLVELNLANEVFGGGEFSALLMDELRRKRGLTYGAYSGFSPMQSNGPWVLQFSTRADKTQEALEATKQVLTNYLESGAGAAQFESVKQAQINQFPLGMASNQSLVGLLGVIGFYDLPLDYLETQLKQLKNARAADAATKFKDVVRPEHFKLVTVGRVNSDGFKP